MGHVASPGENVRVAGGTPGARPSLPTTRPVNPSLPQAPRAPGGGSSSACAETPASQITILPVTRTARDPRLRTPPPRKGELLEGDLELPLVGQRLAPGDRSPPRLYADRPHAPRPGRAPRPRPAPGPGPQASRRGGPSQRGARGREVNGRKTRKTRLNHWNGRGGEKKRCKNYCGCRWQTEYSACRFAGPPAPRRTPAPAS